MSKLLVNCPMRLPDHLVLNGLYREMAQHFDQVIIPAAAHNTFSVKFMLRDVPNIDVLKIEGSMDLRIITARMEKDRVINLSRHGKHRNWDQNYYAQVNMPHEKRWQNWRVDRDESSEITIISEHPYCIMHEDSHEGFEIEPSVGPPSELTCVDIRRQQPIWDYYGIISNAEEIHVIPGAYAIMADSIPTKAKRLVLHLYAKPVQMPKLIKKWEIIERT